MIEAEPSFRGDFDIHLTVAATGAGHRHLAEVGTRLAMKFTEIALARGAQPTQPMFTLTGHGDLAGQRVRAAERAEALRAEGLRVLRTKIEAAPWNADLPADDEAARREPAGRYFEHHVKLLLDAEDLVGLAEAVEPYGAHLSRNARRHRPDGRHERFVTQRCHRVGQPTARTWLARLRAVLDGRGHPVLGVEEEYVVHDDNVGLDDGWLGTGER
ncbi:hypothetical protein E0H26_26570 [Micromonospora zingiberis]|uniref:Uncharacterized protein n=1 Tax=Micromonospora zingiberis TaxID=2053011 RepID=A0A4R0G450_9ACTN|nr:hypothetical protein [Micromonospora zingiberis]TCB90757.1 hypothetical protein E0H26_26570 [Micromonospora zingiberis]